jgi:hypothetical protein
LSDVGLSPLSTRRPANKTQICEYTGLDIMKEEIYKEEEKIRVLKIIVDITQAILMQSELTLQEAYILLENTKKSALRLFPDKEDVYELIYTPRFRRIITERFAGKIH